MNLKEAIAAAQSLPSVFTVRKRNLGPRYSVQVKEQTDTTATLRVESRLEKRSAVTLVLTVALGSVSFAVGKIQKTLPVMEENGTQAKDDNGNPMWKVVDGASGMAEATVLADHLRGKCDKPGPVCTAKTATGFTVGFALDIEQHKAGRKSRREARRALIARQRGERRPTEPQPPSDGGRRGRGQSAPETPAANS